MAGIFKIYERLEIDARKFAQGHKDADDRIKNILETAFLLGEQHIVTKIMNNFMDKEKQKTMETRQMKQYVGTKSVKASPMTMGEAYGRKLLKEGVRPSEDENDKAEYLVEYEAISRGAQ